MRWIWMGLSAMACSGGHLPAEPPAPPVPPTAVAAPPRAAPPPPPLREDETGIAGAPRDETAFEYDVEVGELDAPPRLDGVPPPPRGLAGGLQPFLETRRARLAAVGRDGSMLVLTRLGETNQAHEVIAPLGMRRQLTFGPEPVEQVAFGPTGTNTITYRADAGGTEDYQVFHLHLPSRRMQRLSEARWRYGPFRWAPDGSLAFTSDARNGTDMDLYVLAPGAAEPRRIYESGGQLVVVSWSRDSQRLLVRRYHATDQSVVGVVTVATGALTPLAEAEKGLSMRGGAFLGQDRVIVVANRDRDRHAVFEVELDPLRWRPLTPDLPWEVEEVALASDGTRLVYSYNEEGYSRLTLLDLTTGRSRRLRGIEDGVVAGLRFARDQLAFTLSTPTRPPDAHTYDIASERLTRWTDSEVGGLATDRFVRPELVHVKSFDGETIPAFLYRPAGEGPFPVLLWMHGGPEEQFRPAFDPIVQYFATRRSIAVLAPNVRGSGGYGKRYLALDDGLRRRDAIADVGALLDWIGARSDLDAARVGIHGASYGGFMVLASLVAYPGRILAGSDAVGMSNLVSFLENTRDYRRDMRRAEYGDERDPATRAFLEAVSPLGKAHTIEAALLVAHGENDPRVPLSEAQQIVDAVRANGREAWFYLASGEGHAFRKRRNRDAFYRVVAQFFDQQLLGTRAEPVAKE